MTRPFDAPARLHIEAMRRLLSLCVVALTLFAASRALHWFPLLPEQPGWDIEATSLDLSFGEQRQLLDEAFARAKALHAR